MESCAAVLARLCKAVRNNKLPICKAIVATYGPHPITALSYTGETALHWAALRSQKILEFFISQGIDVNTLDARGSSALMWAASLDSVECVRELLKHRADTTLRNKAGKTAEEQAQQFDRRNVIEVFRAYAAIGSHTKPAIREPATTTSETATDAVEHPKESANLLLLPQEEPAEEAEVIWPLPALPDSEQISSNTGASSTVVPQVAEGLFPLNWSEIEADVRQEKKPPTSRRKADDRGEPIASKATQRRSKMRRRSHEREHS
eukprot:m.290344 g.290344  ORF g.290344 m.290344 type:complete len:263 (-) comp55075_c0_seq3:78-866(-)